MLYAFANTIIDTSTREIRHEDVLEHAEPQVFDVLVHLIENADRVVSKIELLDEVWGDRFVSESALTSRIKSARRLCGDDGRSQRVIRTIHGRGYRFVAELVDPDVPRERDVATASEGDSGPVANPSIGAPGRSAELATLETALTDVSVGRRAMIFVTGEPGIGKSALVRAFVEAADEEVAIVRGQCLEQRGAAEPFFCLLDALSRHARMAGPAAIEALELTAPSWLAQMPSLVDEQTALRLERKMIGATPVRMLREGADAVDAIASEGPTVLVLEDLHWADGPTLDLVEMLAMRPDAASLLVIGTARPVPGPTSDLIGRCTAAGVAARVSLSGLDASGISELTREWSGSSEVDQPIVDALHRASGGVPLFARELLAGWTRTGRVVRESQTLLSADDFRPDDEPVPESLREAISRELMTLSDENLEVLQVAGVAGAEFDGAAVAGGVGMSVPAVESRLFAIAERHHYLEAVGGTAWPDGTVSTRFAFTHDLYRRVGRALLAPARRLTLHRTVGLAIEAGHAGQLDERVGELAHHFVEGGDTPRAVEYLRRAGEQAIARSAHAEALEMLLSALDHSAGLPPGEDRDSAELRIRMVVGPSLVATRGWFGQDVSENYERALELCEQQGPQCQDWVVAQYGLATVTELRGEYETTDRLLQPLVADEDADGVRLEANELLACSTFHQGDFERSLSHAQRVLDRYDPDDFSPAMAQLAEHPVQACNSWASLAAWFLGKSDESLARAEAALDASQDRLYALSTAQVQLAFLHQLRDEADESLRWCEATIETASQQGFPFRVIQADAIAGWAVARLGDTSRGIERLADAMARYAASTARLTQPYFIGLQADALLRSGDGDGALTLCERALEAMLSTTRTFFHESELHRLTAAAIVAAGGDGTDAGAALEQAEAVARRLASPPLLLRAVIEGAQLDLTEMRRTELERLVAGYDGQAPFPDLVKGRQLLDAS